MWEEILKSVPVFLFCSLKFIFGPTLGYAAGLHLLTTTLVTIAAMMTSVVTFTYFGEWMRVQVLDRFGKKKAVAKVETVSRWKKFGLFGIAFLTPIILTPIGGTILAVGLGGPKGKILIYMLVSASFWAVILTTSIYYFGDQIIPEFLK
jgi:hypothetical protein